MAGTHLNPVLAALIVVAASIASLVLIRYLYWMESHRPPGRRLMVILGIWFPIACGLSVFMIRLR